MPFRTLLSRDLVFSSSVCPKTSGPSKVSSGLGGCLTLRLSLSCASGRWPCRPPAPPHLTRWDQEHFRVLWPPLTRAQGSRAHPPPHPRPSVFVGHVCAQAMQRPGLCRPRSPRLRARAPSIYGVTPAEGYLLFNLFVEVLPGSPAFPPPGPPGVGSGRLCVDPGPAPSVSVEDGLVQGLT